MQTQIYSATILPQPAHISDIMKLEVQSAANFLVHLVRLARRNVTEFQLSKFNEALIDVLRRRYSDHWFPERPFKGSGYRCIRINGMMDSLIGMAGESVGLSSKFLHSIFPSELTLWIDPKEVSYRIGENGSICVLYEHAEGVTDPWRPTLNNKNSSSNQNNKKARSEVKVTSTTTSITCKDTMFDQRKPLSIEQLAAYVSS